MIQIQQDLPKFSNLEALINKCSLAEVYIDNSAIDKDIDKLNSIANGKGANRKNKGEIKQIIRYINSIKASELDSKIDLLWELNEYVLQSHPVSLIHVLDYGLEMTDYIDIKEGKLIRLEYKELADIISLELMYRELDETIETMEEKLADIGITGIYNTSELLKHFEDNPFELSRSFKVSDSPYLIKDRKQIVEYFGKKTFSSVGYRDCVDYSIRHALALICESVLGSLLSYGIKFDLCSVSDSGIYFTTNSNQYDWDKIVGESVAIRAFGRRFEIKPRITIF